MKIDEIATADLATLTDEQLEAAARGMLKWDEEDRKRNAILYYRPASPEGGTTPQIDRPAHWHLRRQPQRQDRGHDCPDCRARDRHPARIHP